jgi:predicted TIM-barrel fold metal-dependent hydrolase
MKVIDTHTHLPGRSFGGCPRSGADLRREFESGGLSSAWIMTTDGLLGHAAAGNDALAEAVKGHLDFFVPFCTVSPNEGTEAAVSELARARTALGMQGLKLHPWLQAFSLTHPAVQPILRKAGELGMPVLFHDGTPPYATPLQIAAAAAQAPGTTVILGHAGLDDMHQDAVLACRRLPNVHLCLCGLSSGHMKEAIEQCPADRLLFGSDGGFGAFVVRNAITKIVATGASSAVQERIFFLNPRRLLPRP